MSYEINLGLQGNKINRVNSAVEMADEKKTYYWLEKLNDVTLICINKILGAEIKKIKK